MIIRTTQKRKTSERHTWRWDSDDLWKEESGNDGNNRPDWQVHDDSRLWLLSVPVREQGLIYIQVRCVEVTPSCHSGAISSPRTCLAAKLLLLLLLMMIIIIMLYRNSRCLHKYHVLLHLGAPWKPFNFCFPNYWLVSVILLHVLFRA